MAWSDYDQWLWKTDSAIILLNAMLLMMKIVTQAPKLRARCFLVNDLCALLIVCMADATLLCEPNREACSENHYFELASLALVEEGEWNAVVDGKGEGHAWPVRSGQCGARMLQLL